jgi:SpoVK/Ycf46/Vps4 family AAA+-type ATPase
LAESHVMESEITVMSIDTSPTQRLGRFAARIDGLRQFDWIAEAAELPSTRSRENWDAIHIAGGDKQRLINQALMTLRIRGRVPAERLPLHGIILLVGPPGTGKTTLARGLGQPVASKLGVPMLYLEINAHKLGSAAHGKTQKNVDDLFSETIPSAIEDDYALIVIDEVEVLATAREKLSLAANPIDVHRAVDAALVGIDRLARDHPKVLIVATSNFAGAIDNAFLSRADLVITVPIPDIEGRKVILRDTIEAVSAIGNIDHLGRPEVIERIAVAAEGIDGRQLRKAVAGAIARRTETVDDVQHLTEDDLIATVREVVGR